MAEQPARPRVVNWCAWLIMIGAAFLVLSAFQHVADLGSLESQEAAGRLVDDPPLDDLGITVDDVQRIEQVLSLLAGGAAAAAAILGFEVLRRSRASRRVLSFLAPVLLLAGSVVGGLLAFVVVAAIVMLWSPQAREWFGDPPRAEPTREPEPEPDPEPDPAPGPVPPRSAPARDGGTTVLAPPPATWPLAPPRPDTRRPGAVLAACVLTWVSCALVTLGAAASAAVVLASPDDLVDQLYEQDPQLREMGVGDGLVIGIVVATVAGIVAWSIAAAVVAVFALRRRRWAVIALWISAGAAAAFCLAATVLGGVVALLPLAACVASSVLLYRPESKAWYRER